MKEAAQAFTDDALNTLADIMKNGQSEPARIAAAKELLDRGHGKATQPISGDDDAPPLVHRIERVIVRPANPDR